MPFLISFNSNQFFIEFFFIIGLLKNNVKCSEDVILEFNLFIQFLHDLFKLGV